LPDHDSITAASRDFAGEFVADDFEFHRFAIEVDFYSLGAA
jgi:hypothetical protein